MSEQVDFGLFDAILDKIGHFGKYQILHVVLTGLCAIPVGAFNLANIFLAAVPEYWCKHNQALLNYTSDGVYYQSAENRSSNSIMYTRLVIYNIIYIIRI